jgi:hypothetical protein
VERYDGKQKLIGKRRAEQSQKKLERRVIKEPTVSLKQWGHGWEWRDFFPESETNSAYIGALVADYITRRGRRR